jgi:UDP-N-acetylglucosamine 3-dehydrogenase
MIRIGVVGAGRWGANHIRVLSELSKELPNKLIFTAICDIDISKALNLAKTYNIPHVFSDILEFSKHVDAAIIATPIETLFNVALKMIDRGKHVLIEKPAATTSRDIIMLENSAKKKDAVVGIGYIMRFTSVVNFIKPSLTKFSPIFMLFRRFSRRPEHMRKIHIVFDLAVHDIDLCLYLIDADSWKLEYAKIFHTDIDDSIISVLKVKDLYCCIHVDGVSLHKVREIDIVGTKAFVRGNIAEDTIVIEWDSGESNFLKFQDEEPLKKELRSFIEAIELRKYGKLANLSDAFKVLKIVEEIMSYTTQY